MGEHLHRYLVLFIYPKSMIEFNVTQTLFQLGRKSIWRYMINQNK